MLLLSAYAPLGCLYFVWLPLTCMGKIEATPEDKDDQHSVTRAECQEVSAVVVSALQDSQQAGCDAVI